MLPRPVVEEAAAAATVAPAMVPAGARHLILKYSGGVSDATDHGLLRRYGGAYIIILITYSMPVVFLGENASTHVRTRFQASKRHLDLRLYLPYTPWSRSVDQAPG